MCYCEKAQLNGVARFTTRRNKPTKQEGCGLKETCYFHSSPQCVDPPLIPPTIRVITTLLAPTIYNKDVSCLSMCHCIPGLCIYMYLPYGVLCMYVLPGQLLSSKRCLDRQHSVYHSSARPDMSNAVTRQAIQQGYAQLGNT